MSHTVHLHRCSLRQPSMPAGRCVPGTAPECGQCHPRCRCWPKQCGLLFPLETTGRRSGSMRRPAAGELATPEELARPGAG